MALINTVTIDLTAGIISLASTSSSAVVETITYTNSTQQINFAARNAVTISLNDFLQFQYQLKVFSQAILSNFNPSLQTFTSYSATETNNTTNWALVVNVNSSGIGNALVNYVYTISGQTLMMNTRHLPQSVNYAEWLYKLVSSQQYSLHCGSGLA